MRTLILLLWAFAAALAVGVGLFVARTQAAEPEFTPGTPPSTSIQAPARRYLGVYRVSAYCPCRSCCGKWSAHKRTATGLPARGNIAAVDPRVIDLGDRVHVQGVGELRCEDTGSAIKGRRLDVLLPSHRAAKKFGVKRLKVWGIEENEG